MTYHLFAGKGGVGKTTCAAAAAVGLAERGARVLVVSTDPAHSLGDALGRKLTAGPVRIRTRRGELLAAELDAGRALERWLGERRARLELLLERGTWLDRQDIGRLLDLSLPGVDELIGLIELFRLAGEADYQEVVVDTAPTAHTLRLLAMPGELRRLAGALDRLQEKHRLLAECFGRGYLPDAADALIGEIAAQAEALHALLRDPGRTRVLWVLLPEALSVAETRDGVRALEEAGIPVARLVVDRLTPPPDGPCRLCEARRRSEAEALRELWESFPGREVRFVAAREREPRGIAALRGIAREVEEGTDGADGGHRGGSRRQARRSAKAGKDVGDPAWLADLSPGARLLFFGGKGGVGKTTCAAAAALLLAADPPGRRVLLLSTDPAHSLADVLGVPLGDDERPVSGGPPGLRVRELDPARTFEEWRARCWPALDDWIAEAGSGLDAEAFREILGLAPPGLAEMSAVSVLIDALFGTEGGLPHELVVVDTAPTGHALQLLEMPELMLEWVRTLLALLLKYREAVGLGRLAEELLEMSRNLRRLGGLLRDPERTGFLAVTRAAELPRRETVRLLARLGELGLAVPAVIVDAVTPPGCAACRRAAAAEARQIRWLEEDLSGRCAMILAPAVFPPPRGAGVLADWARTWKKRSA